MCPLSTAARKATSLHTAATARREASSSLRRPGSPEPARGPAHGPRPVLAPPPSSRPVPPPRSLAEPAGGGPSASPQEDTRTSPETRGRGRARAVGASTPRATGERASPGGGPRPCNGARLFSASASATAQRLQLCLLMTLLEGNVKEEAMAPGLLTWSQSFQTGILVLKPKRLLQSRIKFGNNHLLVGKGMHMETHTGEKP
nr:classical arabinogalactan protein 4-like isoform X2 [Equus asinus]